jgi:hypothetical protein
MHNIDGRSLARMSPRGRDSGTPQRAGDDAANANENAHHQREAHRAPDNVVTRRVREQQVQATRCGANDHDDLSRMGLDRVLRLTI